MAHERLKDQIEWHPAPSRYATFFSALLILLALVAVYFSLGDGRVMANARRVFGGAKASAPAASDRLTLIAAHDRTFYWNQEGPFAANELAPRLAAWLQTAKEPHVLITADETGRFGDAASLLEEVRRQGVQQVSLEARTTSTKPGAAQPATPR